MSGRTLLIVGAGVAGLEAAAAARAVDADARILLVTGEAVPFYARIRLSEVVGGRIEPERLLLKPSAWYGEQRLELRLGARVEGVDVSAGTARLADGEVIAYDGLLLATGARPFVPPFPGAGLDGVVTLREMADALDLRRRAQAGGPVVVVGGGLLGLEVGAALRGTGLDVTVVEVAPWLLNRQLDRTGGDLLQGLLERRGLRFRLGASVTGLAGAADRVEAVELGGGERLPASLVVVSAGVRPQAGLARDAGLTVARGICIDDACRTSAPGVFAAGDCAEHRGQLYGIWPASEAQGRVAGRVMAGGEAVYPGTIRQATLKVSDVLAFSMGEAVSVAPSGDAPRELVVREGDVYKKVVLDSEGRAIGAILMGDLKERRAIAAAVTGRQPWSFGS